MESLANKGFINYFGMQRFGTTVITTSSIGLALLRQDYDLAVDLIMRVRCACWPHTHTLTRSWHSRNTF